MRNDALAYDVNGQFAYAGFWWRALAVVIDLFFVWLATLIFVTVLSALLSMLWPTTMSMDNSIVNIIFYYGLRLLPAFIYFSVMESSKKQATLGKRIVGIKVASESGEKISFKVAAIRYLASLLSNWTWTIGIGYLVMLFTKKKQTFHDLIAKTIVVEKAWSKPEIQV